MKISIYALTLILLSTTIIKSQQKSENDSLLQKATLQNCIRYAVAHQPSIQQSLLNEQIASREIKSKIAHTSPIHAIKPMRKTKKVTTEVFKNRK